MAFTDEPAGTIPEGGRFGADTYERARAFLRANEASPTTTPAAPAKVAPVVQSRPKSTPVARPVTAATTSEYTPSTISNEAMTAMARKEAIRPDTTIEETLLGGKAAKTAAQAIGSLLGRAATPAASTSREVATKYDKITPIPNRPSMTRTEAISGPSGGARALPAPTAPSTPGIGVARSPAALQAPPTPVNPPKMDVFGASRRSPMRQGPAPKAQFRMEGTGRGAPFANGGMVKSTPKSTKYACGGPGKKA
jgi:hypothetical protein